MSDEIVHVRTRVSRSCVCPRAYLHSKVGMHGRIHVSMGDFKKSPR